MQFVVIAFDAKDADAPARRQAARQEHLDMIAEYKKKGHMILGAALLDEASGKMNGSVIMADFPTREELDEWLEQDPYVVGNVWKDIKVLPCAVAPSFVHLLPKAA